MSSAVRGTLIQIPSGSGLVTILEVENAHRVIHSRLVTVILPALLFEPVRWLNFNGSNFISAGFPDGIALATATRDRAVTREAE